MTRREMTPEECAELRRHMDKLRELSRQLEFHRQAADRYRVGRDFFIVAAWRLGVPVGKIARAARVHYTRVRQLIDASEEVRQSVGSMYGQPPIPSADDDPDDYAGDDYADGVHENR